MSVGLVQVDSKEVVFVVYEPFKSDEGREGERKASAGIRLRMGDMIIPSISILEEELQ